MGVVRDAPEDRTPTRGGDDGKAAVGLPVEAGHGRADRRRKHLGDRGEGAAEGRVQRRR